MAERVNIFGDKLPSPERGRLERELRSYYRCPAELVEQAADLVEEGGDPAETVEALVACGDDDG